MVRGRVFARRRVIPALNSLWLDLSSTTRRTKHPIAQTFYTLSVMLTVLFELVCVFVATITGTKLLVPQTATATAMTVVAS